MGGLRYVTGDPDRAPSRVGVSIGDALAGTFAALGTMVALHARTATGRGQVVDTAIYEAVLAMMESTITEYSVAGYIRERTGPILPNVAPSNVYRTADDKDVLIAANQDTVFRRLAQTMEQAQLADDPRFTSHGSRGAHQEELDALISTWARELSADKLLERLDAAGVPAGGIYRAPEMLADPHFIARESIVGVPHPTLGELKMQNVVPKLSATPGHIAWCGPELGAHNSEILTGLLGLSEHDIARLAHEGVI